jgi:hypothetical protein
MSGGAPSSSSGLWSEQPCTEVLLSRALEFWEKKRSFLGTTAPRRRWRWRSAKSSEERAAAQWRERQRHRSTDFAGSRANMSSMTSSGSVAVAISSPLAFLIFLPRGAMRAIWAHRGMQNGEKDAGRRRPRDRCCGLINMMP